MLTGIESFLQLAIALMLTQAPSADERFRSGQQLIEANCGECRGRTRSGLEDGIAEVAKALDLGYQDRLGAFRVLADANNTLALVFVKPDSSEQGRFFEERRQLYEKILDLDPADVDTRLLYAMSLRDRSERMIQYRKVLTLSPGNGDAMYGLGLSLVDAGQATAGLAELRKAFDRAEGYTAESYGSALIRVLRGLGREQEAKKVEEQIRAKDEEELKKEQEAKRKNAERLKRDTGTVKKQ